MTGESLKDALHREDAVHGKHGVRREDTVRQRDAARREDALRRSDAARRENALYVVATWVPRRLETSVGALGTPTFERGWYAYVGSARRGRDARVARHLRSEKPLRWHADYLFTAAPARLAWLVDGGPTECELAGALAAQPGASRPVRRFGAGDCRCPGHLVRLAGRPTTRALRDVLRASSPAVRVRALRPPHPC